MSQRSGRNLIHAGACATGDRGKPARIRTALLPFGRRLQFEPLEDRRLLANVTVSNPYDDVNGNVTSIAALIGTPGADGISLREAVVAANADTAADIIDFDVSLTEPIQLSNIGHVCEIAITNNLTINGRGANVLTIRAFAGTLAPGDGERIFNIDDVNFAPDKIVVISGLTLTGGDTPADGGAIRNLEDLTVNECTIIDNMAGGDGGGIFNDQHLSVTQCTITGNTAGLNGGGISNEELMTVAGSLVTHNMSDFGGGIATGAAGGWATATVNLSMVRDNTADIQGGGIFSYSYLIVVDSTILTNVAGKEGGGICEIIHGPGLKLQVTSSTVLDNEAGTQGGGVYVAMMAADPIPAVIRNSTITSNRANTDGGGAFVDGGKLTVEHSTITLNTADIDFLVAAGGVGGGIGFGLNGGSAFLSNTIVAVDTSAAAVDDDVSGPGAADAFYCLIGINTAGVVVDVPDANGGATSQIGVGPPINPLLAPLSNNGGPTLTHRTLPGSPAIDKGDPAAVAGMGTVPLHDQREAPFARVVDGNGVGGARIDIGAYELQKLTLAPALVVDTLVDESDGNYSAGDLSLREAIGLANGNVDFADVITFAPALAGGVIHLSGRLGELAITDALKIDASAAAQVTIDAGNGDDGMANTADGFRIFNVESPVPATLIAVELVALKLTGGDVDFHGGAIRSVESLTVTQCVVMGNASTGGGGGIFATRFSVTSSTIAGNVAAYGGGIFMPGGVPSTIANSTISGNSAAGDGGGIYCSPVRLTVTNCTISGNSAGGGGGGIRGGTVSIFRSTISGNSADYGGGLGVSISSSPSKIVDHTIVAGNLGQVLGPDVYGSVALRYSVIGDNTDAFISDNGGNLIGTSGAPIDPMLVALRDNGGPTKTHALFPGSPAIDAGDPAAVAGAGGVPVNDQRGAPFTRVFNGDGIGGARIDIGAFELQPGAPVALPGDYNQNGIVDAADYVIWRKTLGTAVLWAFYGADGDGDATVDQDDHGVWLAKFGNTLPPPAAGSGAAAFVFSQSAFEVAAEAVVPARSETTTASVGTTLDTARGLRLALFEPRLARQDSVSWPRGRINASTVAESGPDHLLLLLAKDRLKQSSRPAASEVDAWSDDRADELESAGHVDESLLLALTDWQ